MSNGFLRTLTALTATVLMSAHPSRAATRYVSPDGAATAPFTSPETAAVTLQAAVDASAPGDQIIIMSGVTTGTATISHSLTIRGEGATRSILDGTGAGTVLAVTAGATVTFEDLQVRGGSAPLGGGVSVIDSTLTARRCTIRDCHAGRGAGLYANNSTVEAEQLVFATCIADNAFQDQGGKGGGTYLVDIPVTAPAHFTRCLWLGNRATYGGALRLWNSAARIDQCQVVCNRATSDVLEVTEISWFQAVDLLMVSNESLTQSILAATAASQLEIAYLTLTANRQLSATPALYVGLDSDAAIWNSAVQNNAPDTSQLPPDATVAGTVWSTPPDSFPQLTPTPAPFAAGDDGDFYLASSADAPGPLIGAGVPDCPFAIDPAARKIFADGEHDAPPLSAGYGYPAGVEGTLSAAVSDTGRTLHGSGSPFLDYVLEAAADATFSQVAATTGAGHLSSATWTLADHAAGTGTRCYRLRGRQPQGNRIDITVTASGQPAAGTVVDLLAHPDLTWLASTETGADGVATFRNLPNGTVTALAGVGSTDFIAAYLGDTTDSNAAHTIALAGNATATAAVSLAAGGRVDGTVTAAGAPVADAAVTVYDALGTPLKVARTDAAGAYEIGGLAPGQYAVSAVKQPQYAERFWQNADTFSAATLLTQIATESRTAPIALLPQASISGTVTLADGAIPFDIVVVLYDTAYNEITYTYCGLAGDFTLYAPAGTYIVSIGEGSDYVVDYSSEIAIATDSPVTGFNVTLDRGGIIRGTAVTTGGAPASGAYVDFYLASGSELLWVESALTDAYGAYESPLLAPADYLVGFYGAPTYADRWHPDTADVGAAQPVTVSRDQTVSDIDFTVTEL